MYLHMYPEDELRNMDRCFLGLIKSKENVTTGLIIINYQEITLSPL